MDSQDHRKPSPSGNESHGVHLCHKCGWPFPNPHPSAKLRRAHKRICGTMEGHKLIYSGENAHSAVSDDEQGSDEDRRTPGPKIVKRITDEIDGGGFVGRSNRSEDEVFSDAVTDFSDSGFSPAQEERLVGAIVSDSDKNEANVEEGDPCTNQQLKVVVNAGIQIPNIPANSIQLHNPKFFETETNPSRNTMPIKDIVLSNNPDSVVNSNNRTAEFASEGVGSVNCSTDNLSTIKSVVDDREIQSSTMFVGQGSDVNENEEHFVDEVLSDVAVTPSKTASERSTNMAFELQEKDQNTSDVLSVEQFVEPKKDEGYDLSPEDKSCEHLEALVNYAQIESRSALDRDVGNNSDSVEYTKEEMNPDFYVLSVANDIPLVDQPEVMIQDFKDHKYWITNLSRTLDSGEVVEPVVDGNKGTVDEENPSNFHSVKSGEGAETHGSSAVLHTLEGNLKQDDGGDRVLVAEIPVKKEPNSSEVKVNTEDLWLNDAEALPETTASGQIQTDSYTEGWKLHNFHTDSSQKILQESATMGLSSTNDEVSQETDLSGGTSSFNLMEGITGKCDTDGQGSRELVKEELPTIIKTAGVFVDNIFVSKTDQAVNLLGAGNNGGNEKTGIEFSDPVGNESKDVAVQEKPEMNSKMTIEMVCGLSESKNIFDNAMSTDMKNLQEAEIDSNEVALNTRNLGITAPSHLGLQNLKDEDYLDEAVKEPELDSMNEVLAESFRTASEGPESIAQIPIEHIPVESDLTMKSSVTVDDSHCRDGGLGSSGIITDKVEVEGREKLSKQPIEVLAVDASVDSSSRTDSLDGNWGSVSVISTQSDSVAAIDAAEALPSTVSEAPEKSEKVDLQMPKTASKGHHSNKSDLSEAPSFMTLVEPGDKVNQKTATSNFQIVQNAEQQKSEALQAGWFPSLTNIVNESQGRKKNEEIIAKVTNWSTTKQHTPLKSLLGEANLETKPKSPNPIQTPTVTKKDENATKDDAGPTPAPTTVNSILGQEAPPPDQVSEKEVGKEWNSPARYPSENKKEKRKVKGRPYWVPFVCCSSVN